MELIVAFRNFRNFANLPKNELNLVKFFPAVFLSTFFLDKFWKSVKIVTIQPRFTDVLNNGVCAVSCI